MSAPNPSSLGSKNLSKLLKSVLHKNELLGSNSNSTTESNGRVHPMLSDGHGMDSDSSHTGMAGNQTSFNTFIALL